MDTERIKELLVKYLINALTEAERQELEAWREESEANEALLLEVASKKFMRQAITDRNKDLRKSELRRLKKVTVGRGFRRLHWLQIAATVAILLASGFWLAYEGGDFQSIWNGNEERHSEFSGVFIEFADGRKFSLGEDTVLRVDANGGKLVNKKDTVCFLQKKDVPVTKPQFYTLRIPRGKEYVARLEDGSIVHLNSDSELKVPVSFGQTDRRVYLKGEAFFDVVGDCNKRKFIVSTSQADVTVLGTQFDVRAYEEEREMLATLVKGAVQVDCENVSRQLIPGEQARVNETGEMTVERVNVYSYTAWRSGKMVFENITLDRIMAELQRWYDFEVHYANPEVKKLRFTIDIARRDEIEKVLVLIEKTGKVSFTRNGGIIVVQ